MEEFEIRVGDEQVSALLLRPANARALYLFAHGAGAGMNHRSMESNARGLAERGIATLRYQFAYMEKGAKRRTRRASPMQQCERRLQRPCGLRRTCRFMPAGGHSAGA